MKDETKFTVRGAAQIAGVPASTIASELARIYGKSGALTPRAVVDEARPKDAPMHPIFQWNNKRAGDSWRDHQARNLIRMVSVEKGEDSHPVFVHVRTETPSYQPVDVVIHRPDMFALALEELNNKMRAAARAVAQLEEAAKGNVDPDRMARIGIAMRAVEAASEAIRALH